MSPLRLMALVAPASMLAACGSAERVRYKMTVEVDTPEGVRTGSSVREVRFEPDRGGWFALGESRAHYRVAGEAVVVDLPDGQALYALLSSAAGGLDYAARIPDRMLGFGKGKKPTADPVTIWPPAHPEGVPMLVRFRDSGDPKSVEPVEPERLESSFGTGVSLKRIAVQTTEHPITTALESRLRWLGPHNETRLDKDYLGSTNPNTAQRLSYGDFRQGTRK